MSQCPVAYLLSPKESNNDQTNYWIFSEAGLRRIIERTGWEVIRWKNLGAAQSDPASDLGDQRAFCYLRSRVASPS